MVTPTQMRQADSLLYQRKSLIKAAPVETALFFMGDRLSSLGKIEVRTAIEADAVREIARLEGELIELGVTEFE